MRTRPGRLIDHGHRITPRYGDARRFYGAVLTALGRQIAGEEGDAVWCDELDVSGPVDAKRYCRQAAAERGEGTEDAIALSLVCHRLLHDGHTLLMQRAEPLRTSERDGFPTRDPSHRALLDAVGDAVAAA